MKCFKCDGFLSQIIILRGASSVYPSISYNKLFRIKNKFNILTKKNTNNPNASIVKFGIIYDIDEDNNEIKIGRRCLKCYTFYCIPLSFLHKRNLSIKTEVSYVNDISNGSIQKWK